MAMVTHPARPKSPLYLFQQDYMYLTNSECDKYARCKQSVIVNGNPDGLCKHAALCRLFNTGGTLVLQDWKPTHRHDEDINNAAIAADTTRTRPIQKAERGCDTKMNETGRLQR